MIQETIVFPQRATARMPHAEYLVAFPNSGSLLGHLSSTFSVFQTIFLIFLIFHHGIGAPTSHTGFEHVTIGKRGKLSLGDFFHQLHHKFFDCNYGTWETPWDQWFKTFHNGTDKGTQLIAKRRMTLKGQK